MKWLASTSVYFLLFGLFFFLAMIGVEQEEDVTQVGTGHPTWFFNQQNTILGIEHLKIYIHEMLEIENLHSNILEKLQKGIEYPWAMREAALKGLRNFLNW